MVLIKEGLYEIIFVTPILARLVPSLFVHLKEHCHDTYLLKTVINSRNCAYIYVVRTNILKNICNAASFLYNFNDF